MSGHALGAAVYFDVELATRPDPLRDFLEAIAGTAAPDGALVQWMNRVDGQRMPPGEPYDLAELMRIVRTASMRAVAVETPPKTADSDFMLVLADTTPVAKLRESDGRSWRYRMHAAFGAARLQALGAQHVLDAIVAFADAVAVKAGVVLWGVTAEYASTAAWSVGFTNLPPEQRSRLLDGVYWESRWGEVIRGPVWGTFLNAGHVEKLGGFDHIESDSGSARVRRLTSGGGFLEATSPSEPILDYDDQGKLSGLVRFLEPVMGKPPAAT